MPEPSSPAIAARDRAPCPACGAEGRWNAEEQSLACPYCGTTAPRPPTTGAGGVREHDLAAALRAIPAERRGWEHDRVAVECRSCKAISLFMPERVAQRCEFCGSPQVVPYEETRAPIVPESVLPFRIGEAEVRDRIRRWYRSRWFAPSRLGGAALTDTLHGVYVPYWTFDARAHARWSAEAGHYYWVEVPARDAQGRATVRRERRTRWESASGVLDHAFDDALVPGTRGVPPDLLHGVEPFPTAELTPYDPTYVAGWVVEQYQIDLVAAAARARETMEEVLRGLCAAAVPGDTHRNLEVDADWTDQTFKHVLVPIWLLTYVFGRRTFQVVVNGSTGRIAGRRPWSWVKIALAVLAVAVVASLAVLVGRSTP